MENAARGVHSRDAKAKEQNKKVESKRFLLSTK